MCEHARNVRIVIMSYEARGVGSYWSATTTGSFASEATAADKTRTNAMETCYIDVLVLRFMPNAPKAALLAYV